MSSAERPRKPRSSEGKLEELAFIGIEEAEPVMVLDAVIRRLIDADFVRDAAHVILSAEIAIRTKWEEVSASSGDDTSANGKKANLEKKFADAKLKAMMDLATFLNTLEQKHNLVYLPEDQAARQKIEDDVMLELVKERKRLLDEQNIWRRD